MATNFPGPYQLRLFYTSSPGALPAVQHVMQFNVDCDEEPTPGDLFADIDIVRRVGVPVALETVTNALVSVLVDIMSDADEEIVYAEFWKYEPGTFEAEWISTMGIAEAGTFVGAALAAAVGIYTFRTQEGGVMHLYHLEGPDPGNNQQSYSGMSSGDKTFADHIIEDTTSFWLGRDTSYPIAFLRKSPGQHETTFKQRFR